MHRLLPVAAALALAALAGLAKTAPPPPAPLFKLLRTVPLPGVEGRIDHLALDAAEKRLVVAALWNNTVEVLDLEKGTVEHTLRGLAEPQGVVILPETGRIAVSCGEDGSLRFFDGKTLAAAGRVDLGADADNVRLEAETGRLVVGFGSGGLAFVKDGQVAAKAPLEAHPESFRLAARDARIFVNVPRAGHVAVVDRTLARVIATWPLREASDNCPLAFDEGRQRLLVGCRTPPRLLVIDTDPSSPKAGKAVASIPISGDVDDIWIDAPAKRIDLSCGEGFVDVVEQADADRYTRLGQVPTAAGARTSLFAPASGRLHVTVPHKGTQAAEVRVYSVKP